MGLLELPFSGGIDEATRAELIDPATSFSTVENVRQFVRGGFGKRYGFAALTTTQFGETTPTTGYRHFADRQTVVRIVDNQAEVLSVTADRWRTLTRVPEADYRLSQLAALGTSSNIQDVEVCNGYICAIYNTSAGGSNYTFAAILDAATLAIVRAPEQLGAGSYYGQVVSYGTRFVAVFADESGNTIRLYTINVSSAANIQTGWSSLTTATDWNTLYPVQACSLSDRIAIAYVNNSGGTDQVTCSTYDSTGLLETQTINTSSATPTVVAIGGSIADTLWVAWNETTSVKIIGLDADDITTTALATTATIITLTTGARGAWLCPSATAGKGRLVVSDTATTARTHIRGFQTTAGAAATDGAQVTSCGSVACGKPFLRSGRYYQPFYAAGITGSNATSTIGNLSEYGGQQTFIICDITEDQSYVRPVVSVSPGTATQSTFMQGKCAAIDANTYVTPCAIKVSTDVYAPTLVTMDFASTARWAPATIGASTYLSGGVLSCYDGQRVFEAGFMARPTKPTTSTSSTGITATVGWTYVAVYEAVDGDGNWHVSGVSDVSASTGAVSNKTVTVTTTPLGISARGSATNQASSVRVTFYRSLDGGEPPYYRLGSTINAPGTATVTYSDTTDDATLRANAKLYSQPGVRGTAQDRRPPPGLKHIVEYGGMLVGSTGPDIWHSGQQVSGEGTWFNPLFVVTVPEDVTALAVQDGTLFAFTRRNVFAIAGEPPSDNAAIGGMGTPRRLAVDVGCIEPRSICVTTMGVFFQSERGIELLTRAQTVEWIGEAVSTTLDSYPIVTAATLDAASTCVLIECAASQSSGVVSGNGRTLVYDLSMKRWVSIDRRANSLGTADSPAQSGCMVYTSDGYRYSWLGADGTVYTEDRTAHIDPGATWVTMRVETGWFKLGGVQARQRLERMLLLARRATDHNLSVYAAYDYSTTYKTAAIWPRSALAALVSAWPTQQIDFPLHVESEGQSMRLKFEDATPTGGTVGTGQGATWIALTLDGTAQKGAAHLPSIAR